MFRFLLVFSLLLSPLSCGGGATEAAGAGHPFLWRINTEPPSYLYGTLHIPDQRILQLHPDVEAATTSCDALYIEVSMEESDVMRMIQTKFLPEGRTLRDYLSDSLYQRVDQFLRRSGASMADFERMQIWALAANLTLLEGPTLHPAREAVDVYLYRTARARGKEVGGIETLDEQIGVFEAFNQEEQIRQLEFTLQQMEEYEPGKSYLEELIQSYLSGEDEQIMELFDIYDESDPLWRKFKKLLLTDRNLRMAERVAEKLKQNPGKAHFFAFGAAHLTGADGVPELLRAYGFDAERLHAP